jgi:Ca-activated chloride channel homolog
MSWLTDGGWFSNLTSMYPSRIHVLWAVLLLFSGLAYLRSTSRDTVARFVSPVMQTRLVHASSWQRGWWQLGLLMLSVIFAVLALLRPQARGKTETVVQGTNTADVMFVLDVSKSMLAEDAAPNRLARAKAEVSQLVARLPGHRVGLIAFAGRSVQVCPLTPDRSFFDLVLTDVNPATAGRGGTRIGEAVKVALRAFPDGAGGKLIVLITDGEDQESFPLEAAKAARSAGVKIVAVGLGDEKGSQIIITDPKTGAKNPMMHDGAPVISRLDGETLRQMALATDGAYIPAGTAALDLESIMESFVRPLVDSGQGTTRVIPVERFSYFVLLSLLTLMIALALGMRPTSRGKSVLR